MNFKHTALLLVMFGFAAPLMAQTKPDEKLIAAQVDLKMAMEQMPEYLTMIRDIAKKSPNADFNELRAAIDRLRRSIRMARGESRCFKTGAPADINWRVRALEQDLQTLEKDYYKLGQCDIPFLIDDIDAIPVAIANTLKPITMARPSAARKPAVPVEPDHSSTLPSAAPAVEDIKAQLAAFRAAAAAYVAANKGKSFSKAAVLLPKYMKELPVLRLPGVPASNTVMVIENDSFPPDIGPALSGAGGWVIIGDSKSERFGQVYINSSDTSSENKPWYQY